ncbi:MAG: 1-deoxy-D-xylulose-5-phosphate reductoisomerase [Bacilli bacterium]|nr:1-deoxy-D-xylulose-5-phosphate reductoisomerase [Bacilli bacterium]
MRKLILLGASGNIGEQTLTILKKNRELSLVAFSVGEQTNKIKTILKAHPSVEAICVKHHNDKLFKQFPKIKFYVGNSGLVKLIKETKADIVLNALVGFVGLAPTLAAIKNDMDVALANKESLVVGGELIHKALRHAKSKIYPVDSEHSAIYKCFQKCKKRNVKEIFITASGGAFRHLTRDELKKVTPSQALKHPTWKMGDKVTIDSASMLNKGFEIIEAYYLFNFPLHKIKVLMHDESYVHSILHLKDGSYLGEVNPPSMLNPIAYALSDHKKIENIKHVKSLKEFGSYHFHEFDKKRYPMVSYAIKALLMKGTMPCVLNAVDEVAVDLFLKKMISFLDIERIVALALDTFKNYKHPNLKTLIQVDHEARQWAKSAALLRGSL